VQQTIDKRVHILIAGLDLHAGRNRTTHGVEARLKFHDLVGCQHARLRQRGRPSLGKLDVERPEPKIDAYGPVDGLEFRGRTASEPASPELV
jgi:hypothetical protein